VQLTYELITKVICSIAIFALGGAYPFSSRMLQQSLSLFGFFHDVSWLYCLVFTLAI